MDTQFRPQEKVMVFVVLSFVPNAVEDILTARSDT